MVCDFTTITVRSVGDVTRHVTGITERHDVRWHGRCLILFTRRAEGAHGLPLLSLTALVGREDLRHSLPRGRLRLERGKCGGRRHRGRGKLFSVDNGGGDAFDGDDEALEQREKPLGKVGPAHHALRRCSDSAEVLGEL